MIVMFRTVQLIGICSLLLLAAPAFGQSDISGLDVGAPTHSIPVLDITGDYQGQRICYVCEFQDDPNVLAFFRETGDETAEFIVQLNDLYLRHRDSGFRAVAMIVAGEDATAWLEALNESADIEIPLTVFRRGPRDVAARLYELNPEVENTFLVTINRFVAANVADIGPDQFDRVAAIDDRTQRRQVRELWEPLGIHADRDHRVESQQREVGEVVAIEWFVA